LRDPNESERERITTDAVRELMLRFEGEKGDGPNPSLSSQRGLRSRETPKP
jgi:hypothetical protein